MSKQMRESNSGVGRRVLAALAGWFRRLRGADVRPDRGIVLPPPKPIVPDGTAPAGKPLGNRVQRRRPPQARKPSRRPSGESAMDGAELTVEQLCRYLGEDGFGCTVREGEEIIETGFRGRSGAFRLIIFLREEPALLGILVRIPEVVPEPQRPQMAETVVRANYGLSLGCFELDMGDGELDFRVSMPTPNAALTHEQFRCLLGAAMWTTDRYHRAFCRLIYGDDLSPAEVVAEVEMADLERGDRDDKGEEKDS